jgi:fatty acid desaturase
LSSSLQIESLAQTLTAQSYRAIPRIFLDLFLWSGTAGFAIYVHRWWFTVIAVFLIGFGPFHDLLVQGHEGTHDLISRNRRVNEFFTWFTLALAGISAEAHRHFHLDHHHYAHTQKDPEYQFFNRVLRGVPGWAYLLIPAFAQVAVNRYGLQRDRSSAARHRVAMELAAGLALHASLAFLLGLRSYLLFVAAPMLSGLYVASVLRSVTEHHDVAAGSKWTNARSIVTHPVLEFLWSNVNYHLEHHLYPSVPYHALPELRRALAPEYFSHGSNLEAGYGHTALVLLRDPRHFAPPQETRQSIS